MLLISKIKSIHLRCKSLRSQGNIHVEKRFVKITHGEKKMLY